MPQLGDTAAVFDGVAHMKYAVDPNDLVAPATDPQGYPSGATMDVVREGCVWVDAEAAVTEGDPVYVRLVVTGDEVYGAFRAAPDANDCGLLRRARFASTTSAAGKALVELLVRETIGTNLNLRTGGIDDRVLAAGKVNLVGGGVESHGSERQCKL
jgi:hypothetical protein